MAEIGAAEAAPEQVGARQPHPGHPGAVERGPGEVAVGELPVGEVQSGQVGESQGDAPPARLAADVALVRLDENFQLRLADAAARS